MMKIHYLLTTIFTFAIFLGISSPEFPPLNPEDKCFCQLKGKIDDCTCSVDTVDYFNNVRIYPIMQSLLGRDYFRYYKIALNRGCPFWHDDSKCAVKDCSIQMCPEEKIPAGLKNGSPNDINTSKLSATISKYSKEAQEMDNCDENHGDLGLVNDTISDSTYEDFTRWQEHDDSLDTFCEPDDESADKMQYVDLLNNPEKFTGYHGKSAHRVWRSIYQENCFQPLEGYGPYTTSKTLNELCLEKRAFYRIISGMHTSITIHVCSQFLFKDRSSFGSGSWRPNLEEFLSRFDPELTDSEGPQWLRNLYFLYLLELRALAKVAPYLEDESFYTGYPEEDSEVKNGISALLKIVVSFPDHFNESKMFSHTNKEAPKLLHDFKQHFRNISRIMDCVGCDKCRLWGTVQIKGIGTALKILFSSDNSLKRLSPDKFHLTRTEIVSLFNAFGRVSNSVYQIEKFRKMLKEQM